MKSSTGIAKYRYRGPPPSYPTDDNRNCTPIILVIFIIIAFITTLATIHFVTKTPDPKFEVQSVLRSPINITNSNQTAINFTIGISVRNPSHYNPIVFHNPEVSIFYNTSALLAKTAVEPFRLGPKKETGLVVEPKVPLQGLSNSIRQAIADEGRDGVVSFCLNIRVKFANILRLLSTAETPMTTIDVGCLNLEVRFSSYAVNGTMLGGSKKCSVTAHCT